ncbi:protein TANC1-like [Saccostrea cucullata]|uniref:protein TANC1-like n=1 Tax=Saccostrea cuccullata TaxID=36930 RepID=UPI002ECFE160
MEELKQMGRRLLVLEKECHIPIHIKEQHKQVLQKWIVHGESFQETRAYKRAKEIIDERGVLFIVGGPGSGKTFIARHLAIQFQTQKWEIIPVGSPDEIRQYLYPVINQMFVLDNPFGSFGLDMSKYDCFMELFDYLSCLSKVSSTKIIFTCRKNVYVECNDLEPFPFEAESTIDIESNEYHLNGEERLRILETYCIKRNIPKVTYEHISVENNYPMFPLLCSLLREGMDIHQRLNHPIECLQKELLIMRKCESITFVVLVLCVFRNNTCADKFLDENRQLLSELLSNCGLSHNTPISAIRDAFIKLEGTYLSDVKDRITFTHDSVFEVVSHMYGKENTRHFLENISFEYLNNNVEIVTSRKISSNSSILQLQLEDCFHLSVRIYNEIRQLNYHLVFGSKKSFLKDTKFITSFLRFLDWVQFAEIVDMFLVDHLHSSKWFDFEDVYSFQGHKSFRRRILTSHSSDKNMQKVRALSWVLAFGHKEILCYLIKRAKEEMHGELTRLEVWELFLTDDLQEQTRLLMLACLSGELKIVNFVTRHFDNDCLKIEYPTGLYVPILVSCLTPYPHVVEALIRAGANVNATENAYYNVRDTSILIAVKNKHTFVVKVLIEYGADVNKCNLNGETPLIIASRIGSLEIVKLLVENGADVEFLDMEGKTALFYGIKNRHAQIVNFLLEKGSDVSKFIDDKQSISVLDLHFIVDCPSSVQNIERIMYRAAEFGRIDILEYINEQKEKAQFPELDMNFLVYVTCKNAQFDALNYLIKNGFDVNFCDEQHTTPLCAASGEGDLSIVSFLIENEAVNPNQIDVHQKSALHWATENSKQVVIEYLVKKGASVNILDINKTSPLHNSCAKGNYEIVRFLLTHGADLNVKMKGGETPLFCAIANGRLKIMELLIKRGADIHTFDSRNVSLLHLGSRLGNIRIVQRLVDLGCDTNKCDRKNGNEDIVGLSSRNFANVNTADLQCQTPLHMAVQNNHTGVIQLLLKHGADVNAADKFGKTAFDYASDEILNEFLFVILGAYS